MAHFYFGQELDKKKKTENKRLRVHISWARPKSPSVCACVPPYTKSLFLLLSYFVFDTVQGGSKAQKCFLWLHLAPLLPPHTGQQSCVHVICELWTVYSISCMTIQGNGLQSRALPSEMPQLNYQLSVRRKKHRERDTEGAQRDSI